MNLPGVLVDLPTLTEKDIQDIKEWGIPNNIDLIATSYVRTKASDVHKIRERLGEERSRISRLFPKSKIKRDCRIMMPFSKRLTASWCLEVIWEWKLSFWHRK
jgi:pyruvate kinase